MKKTSGMSLMLLIFLSLCLITFSLLSLSSATADYNLSEKTALRTKEYYAADSVSNLVLADLDQQLVALLKETSRLENVDQEAVFYQKCTDIFSPAPTFSNGASSIAAWDYNAEEHCVTYEIPLNSKQHLLVKILLCYPHNAEDLLYNIHTWTVRNTTTWIPDTSMHVYQAN